MIGKVKLLSNYKELEEYNNVINEYGITEAFSLGKFDKPVQEKFMDSELLFNVKDISLSWIVNDDSHKMINIKLYNDDLWTLYHTEELWNKLKTHFNK